MIKKLVVVVLLLALIAVAVSAVLVYRALLAPLPIAASANALVVVHPGDTVNGVLARLAANGQIENPEIFKLYLRHKPIKMLHFGEYELAKGARGVDLLAKLRAGEVVQHRLTFVEGSTFKQLLNAIGKHPKLIDDVSEMSDAAFKEKIGVAKAEAEGWFFPETYQFVTGYKASQLLRSAHLRMQKELASAWQKRQPNLPYKTPYDLLIMASLIEKETGAPHERAEIAGVFVRRLNLGMRLQTDPTVIYGMFDNYQGKLRRSDLQRPHPWNTYVIPALPKTPIAMPGRAALQAAAQPQAGKSLYFVAKGDGTHFFSDSLAEHNRAVVEYQKNRRSDYRSQYRAPAASSKD